MTTNLFSTYRQGENRVTATFIAVLQRLSLPNIDRILRVLLGEESYSLVSFVPQPKGKGSTLDARIQTSPGIWIETKTERDAVRRGQIKNHLEVVKNCEKLLVLTPDEEKPGGLTSFQGDERVVWYNFITLAGAVDEILSDEDYPPSEREAFLLREFVSMLREEGLLSKPEVLVVAARHAWPEYKTLGAYITRPKSFRPSSHLAFYAKGAIQHRVPSIIHMEDALPLTEEGIANFIDSLDEELKPMANDRLEKIQQHQQDAGRYMNFTAKVLFLSEYDAAETVKLDNPITNNKKGKDDKTVPFTYGARYVTLEAIQRASRTSDLES